MRVDRGDVKEFAVKSCMSLADTVREISAFYQQLGDEFSQGQARSGLNCLSGCGECCTTPEIEASLWEMLPMAWALVEAGRGEEVAEELSARENSLCWAYQSESADHSKGRCVQYADRPTICREFGVAGLRDKNNQIRLSVCKPIRSAFPQEVLRAEMSVNEWSPPLMNEWSLRLTQLHPDILHARQPINHALLEALHKLLLYKTLNACHS